MNRPELYQKTVGILVDSYFNDTLVHGNCYACAVGNMIAANCQYSFEKDGCRSLKWKGFRGYYHPHSATVGVNDSAVFFLSNYIQEPTDLAIIQMRSTGYSMNELEKIERAFEGVIDDFSLTDEELMFAGLMAVVDALDKIHENNDQSITQQSKKRFDKSVSLI